MSGGGGKSGSEVEETSIPEWIKQPAIRNLQRAEDVQRIEYMPYRGPEVAGFTPSQISAFQNNLDTARAFGLAAPESVMDGIPTPSTFAGGVSGYSTMPLYEEALAETIAAQPDAVEQYNALFGKNVATTANPNPLPTGRPSGGGGNVTNNPTTPTTPSTPSYTPNTPTAMQNYLDDSQLNYQTINSAYDNYNSPGHPSRANYNYDDPDDVPTDRTARAMDDTADIEAGMQPQLSSRLDSKGYTPTNVSRPIDEIMADFLAGK